MEKPWRPCEDHGDPPDQPGIGGRACRPEPILTTWDIDGRTSRRDQVHGVPAKLGIEVTCPGVFGAWGTQWLDELPLRQPYCWKVASLRQLTNWLTAEITVLERVTADLLAGHDYRAVRALTLCGPVRSARSPRHRSSTS